jgi:hypothetical protein
VAETTVREMELDGMELVSFPDSGEPTVYRPAIASARTPTEIA